MAIASTTVWEVRTTGDATNGGGFNSARGGTDYSQQDTAQLSLTDLACASNTTLTSATGGFTAAMVGNLIYIASGTNAAAGFYEITAYTDTNTVTIDRTCASGGDMTDGVGKVGGAALGTTTIASAVVAGNSIYIQNGTYNETLDTAVAGTRDAPVKWIGYITNHSTIAYGNDRPLFDGESTRANCIVNDKASNHFYNIRAANATGANVSVTGASNLFWNIKSSSAGTDGFGLGTGINAFYCESSSNGDKGFEGGGTLGWCYIHDNASYGIGPGTAFTIYYSVVESNSNSGLVTGTNNNMVCIGNIAYNNTGATSDGFQAGASGANRLLLFINNGSYSNGRYGFNLSSNQYYVLVFKHNSYYGNGTAGANTLTPDSTNITTDPLFTNAAANPPDFTLQSSSPLIAAGLPDASWAINIGLVDAPYKTNIGIDQDDNTSVTGGGSSWFAGE